MRVFNSDQVPLPTGDFSFTKNLNKPFALEIGAGTGDFAIRWAQNHPDQAIIAVEKTKEKYRKFVKKYEDLGKPQNLFPVHANAINFIVHFIDKESLSHCFINYPNPYPKKMQANKRFHNMPFMKVLKTKIIKGGILEMASNLSRTIEEAKFQLSEIWGFNVLRELKLQETSYAQSAFELKYLSRGETCTRVTFIK